MTVLDGELNKIQIEETDKKSINSERLMQKIGKNINALNQRVKYDVGDIQYSQLNESQFQTEHDSTWILADGRNVEGTEYQAVTGDAFVPDMRAMFLRQVNTSSTGIDANRVIRSFQESDNKNHDHPMFATGGADTQPYLSINGDVTTGITSRDHRYSSSTGVPDAGRTLEIGGDEARPVNVALNIYIKINEA